MREGNVDPVERWEAVTIKSPYSLVSPWKTKTGISKGYIERFSREPPGHDAK